MINFSTRRKGVDGQALCSSGAKRGARGGGGRLSVHRQEHRWIGTNKCWAILWVPEPEDPNDFTIFFVFVEVNINK